VVSPSKDSEGDEQGNSEEEDSASSPASEKATSEADSSESQSQSSTADVPSPHRGSEEDKKLKSTKTKTKKSTQETKPPPRRKTKPQRSFESSDEDSAPHSREEVSESTHTSKSNRLNSNSSNRSLPPKPAQKSVRNKSIRRKPSTTIDVVSEPPTRSKNGTSSKKKVQKKKKKAPEPTIEPAEAWAYLLDWEEQHDSSDSWEHNETAEAWLIQNMYDAEAVPKDVFAFLVEGYMQEKPESDRVAIRADATRRALRYKEYEKQVKDGTWQGADDNDDDDDDDESVWNRLEDHDKRKVYKRARKTLDVVKV